MIAICTKYLGWTETLPSRIKAYTHNGQEVTVSVHAELLDRYSNDVQMHCYVAGLLAQSCQWYTPTNYLIGGTIAEGYCFVFSDSDIIAPKDGPTS